MQDLKPKSVSVLTCKALKVLHHGNGKKVQVSEEKQITERVLEQKRRST